MKDFIKKLNAIGIKLKLHNDNIEVFCKKKENLTDDLLSDIKKNKSEIIDFLKRFEVDQYFNIEKAIEKDHYPLSSAQRRLYFLHGLSPESTAYNMPQLVPIEDALEDRLKSVLERLIERHESFRTSFVMVDDEPMQVISPKVTPQQVPELILRVKKEETAE